MIDDKRELDQQAEEVRGKGRGPHYDGAWMPVQETVHDPRLSKLIAWGGAVAATVVATVLLWAGTQLVGIRESLASMATTQREQSLATSMQISDLKAEMRTLRQSNDYLIQKVASLEGKAERGFRQGKEPFRE